MFQDTFSSVGQTGIDAGISRQIGFRAEEAVCVFSHQGWDVLSSLGVLVSVACKENFWIEDWHRRERQDCHDGTEEQEKQHWVGSLMGSVSRTSS